MENGKNSRARAVCRIGLMAAAIECAKLVLAALPNIEAVTLLVAVFSFVFGWQGLAATVIFVAVEPLIWGFGTWVISYIIYWPLVSVAFILLSRIRFKRVAVKLSLVTAVAVLLTVQLATGACTELSVALATKSLASGEASNYEAEYQERVKIWADDSIQEVILQPYVNRPIMLYVGDFSSDINEPTNQKVAEYYHKKSVRVEH